jgi:hypothetical protein
MKPKPRVFVGSSSEGLSPARAIQAQLADDADIDVWKDGVLGLTRGVLEGLTQSLSTYDFAILVLTPDDLVVSRGKELPAARDNVLIELGLFMGRLGRERTFLVASADEQVKVPADLEGITFATYSRPADDARWLAAVGPACTRIRLAMEAQGRARELARLHEAMKEQQERMDDQAVQLQHQQERINELVKYSMSASIFHHLCGIALLREYTYNDDPPTRRELYFLRDGGYIRPVGGGFLDFDERLQRRNLAEVAEPTPTGWTSIRLRKDEIPSNMREDLRNLKVDLAKL